MASSEDRMSLFMPSDFASPVVANAEASPDLDSMWSVSF
jgi:hypothetical protein